MLATHLDEYRVATQAISCGSFQLIDLCFHQLFLPASKVRAAKEQAALRFRLRVINVECKCKSPGGPPHSAGSKFLQVPANSCRFLQIPFQTNCVNLVSGHRQRRVPVFASDTTHRAESCATQSAAIKAGLLPTSSKHTPGCTSISGQTAIASNWEKEGTALVWKGANLTFELKVELNTRIKQASC